MSEFVRIADVSEIEPGHAEGFSVGRFEIAVFNVDGTLFALENICPHQGGPIADGWFEGTTITCPWHAWCFDVRTGKMTLGDYAHVPRFAIEQRDGGIWVGNEPENER